LRGILVTNQRSILTPFHRNYLEEQLQQTVLSRQLRQRIEIMLLADEGKTQSEICRLLGCSAATAGRWILLAEAQMAHKCIEISRGRPKKADDKYQNRLRQLVQSSPAEYGYSFRYWTAGWLSKHLAKELKITVGDRQISRLLKELGLSTLPKTPVPDPGIPSSKIIIRNLGIEPESNLLDI
jgi:transposase